MLSTFTWMTICFILIIIKYAFIKPVEDNRLYAMYEARDNVALAAIEGKISQDAEEYNFVIHQINFEIFYMENMYDFSILFRNLVKQPEKVKEYFEARYKLIKEYDILLKSFHKSSSHFAQSLKYRTIFFFYLAIIPFYCFLKILSFFLKLKNFESKLTSKLTKKMDVVVSIKADYDEFQKGYLKKA